MMHTLIMANRTSPDLTIATLHRPASIGDSTWVEGVWTYHAPTTTFVCVGDRVWLLTGGSRDGWRVMAKDDAKTEWRRLRSAGYTRSEDHVVDVVALATMAADQKFVINDAWTCYSAGTARAAVCPVLRSRRYPGDSWSICLDVECTESGKGSVAVPGAVSVQTRSIYGYEVATAIVNDSTHWGCTFEGVSDDVRVKTQHANGVHYIAA